MVVTQGELQRVEEAGAASEAHCLLHEDNKCASLRDVNTGAVVGGSAPPLLDESAAILRSLTPALARCPPQVSMCTAGP